MVKILSSWIRLLFTELKKFLNKRLKSSSSKINSVISNSRINYNINSLLTRYGVKLKTCELDREEIYKYEQNDSKKFIVIKVANKIDGQSILVVIFNGELVYLTGDYIHQVYKPGKWEQKLEILANN